MALLEWSQRLALGVARMDDTHREFIEQLNALHDASGEDYLSRLDRFIGHTVEHFAQEKRWMHELQFPPIHCHLKEHEGVLNIMRDVRRMVAEGQPELGKVLTRELAPWFENHARGMDAMLAYFMRCAEAGVDPMQALAAQSQGSCAGESMCGHDARTSST